MSKQEIIVVGASAGGVEALREFAAGLPADLEAAVFAVLHIGTGLNGRSYLPQILSKAGPLPAVNPTDTEIIRNGTIYVAPPDCHMLLEPGYIRLSHGPKENRTRPAINPLFRSAAHAYGPRVTGLIMTGMQDDGVAGLAEIKRNGGVAIVEDPRTALFPSMPSSALSRVDVDYVASLPDIPGIVARLSRTERQGERKEEPVERTPSDLTCPECRGPLTEERQGKIVEYRCRVGHVFTPLSMKNEHRETVERSLWSAIVALEEGADIAEILASDLTAGVLPEEAGALRERAALLKKMMTGLPEK